MQIKKKAKTKINKLKIIKIFSFLLVIRKIDETIKQRKKGNLCIKQRLHGL